MSDESKPPRFILKLSNVAAVRLSHIIGSHAATSELDAYRVGQFADDHLFAPPRAPANPPETADYQTWTDHIVKVREWAKATFAEIPITERTKDSLKKLVQSVASKLPGDPAQFHLLRALGLTPEE